MKAIQIVQPGEITLTSVPEPVMQPDEVLVKIKYVGFCGSDLNTYLGKNPMVKLPVVPGHEIGGVIDAVGEKAPAYLKSGMSCTVNPYTACGACPSCRNNRPNACQFNQTFGVQRNGAMCEYIVVPWSKIIADQDMTPMDFCLVEPMSVGFHAVGKAQVTDSDTVMVIGCGMIGVGAIVRAALRGAKVIASDIDDAKLELAKRMGAAYTVSSRTGNVHEQLQKITNNDGPDVVIEAVGSTSTYQTAIEEVAFTGRVVCIGYAKTGVTLETKLFVQKELDISGSRNAMPEDFRAVMEYIKRKSFPVEELVSGIYPPEQAREALEYWKENPGKVFRLLIEF